MDEQVDGHVDGQTVLDTRARILEAALELFGDKGFENSSLRELAGQLGITKAAILYHFPSKAHLLATLAEPLVEDLEEAVEGAGERSDRGEIRRLVIEGSLEVFLRHRRLLRLVVRDVTVMAQHHAFVRLIETIRRAHDLLAGPEAGLGDRIRATQIFAMLSDPVTFYADLPTDVLRAEVLAGVRCVPMTSDPPAWPTPPTASTASTASASASATGPVAPNTPATSAERRRRPAGRPSLMDGDKAARARRLYATGEHTVAEIASMLGVSRATVYRHLPHGETDAVADTETDTGGNIRDNL